MAARKVIIRGHRRKKRRATKVVKKRNGGVTLATTKKKSDKTHGARRTRPTRDAREKDQQRNCAHPREREKVEQTSTANSFEKVATRGKQDLVGTKKRGKLGLARGL